MFVMTPRILVDVARYASDQDPTFEHNIHFGDEEVIRRLRKVGQLGAMPQDKDESTNNVPKNAIKL